MKSVSLEGVSKKSQSFATYIFLVGIASFLLFLLIDREDNNSSIPEKYQITAKSIDWFSIDEPPLPVVSSSGPTEVAQVRFREKTGGSLPAIVDLHRAATAMGQGALTWKKGDEVLILSIPTQSADNYGGGHIYSSTYVVIDYRSKP